MLTLLLHLVCYTIAAAIFSMVVDAYASKPQQGPGSFVLRQLRAPILLSILLVAGYDLLDAHPQRAGGDGGGLPCRFSPSAGLGGSYQAVKS